MSSLMQHDGARSRDGRKVRLLIYLQHDVETPLKCSQCGHDGDMESKTCQKCKCVFTHIFYTPKNAEQQSIELFHDYTEQQNRDCQNGLLKTGYLSNRWQDEDTEPIQLTRPDGSTTICPKLYAIYRRPIGMFGCWVVFRWNNAERVPDLSVPIHVAKLPRDAKPLSDSESTSYWFKG